MLPCIIEYRRDKQTTVFAFNDRAFRFYFYAMYGWPNLILTGESLRKYQPSNINN